MMNLNQLYYFFVIARAGGVTVAAKQLRVSQPSLSAQIKTLEHTLGKKLFERTGRGLRLSRDGDAIYGQCRKIFEAAESLEKSLKGVSETQKLHLGVSNEIERPFLVEIIGKIHRGKFGKSISMITMASEDHDTLLSQIKTRAVDAAILNEPTFDPEISMLTSSRMPVVLAFKADGRYGKLRSLLSGGLKQANRDLELRWALPPPGMRLRRETDQFFEKMRIEARASFESDVLAAVVRAVVDDVGVALLPLQYLGTYAKHRSIDWISPAKGYWQHGIWLATTKRDMNLPKLDQIKHAFTAVLNSKSGPARYEAP